MSDEFPKGWSTREAESLYDRLKVQVVYDKNTVRNYGKYEVIDQSQSESIGYVNDGVLNCDSKNPIVTFANHTCAVRKMTRAFGVIQNVFPLKAKDDIDPHFLYQLLRDAVPQTGYKGHYPELREKQFTVPTRAEQQKIAEILTSVDEVIENTQSQIKKLEDLKKATINELFTKGIGHTEFKETEMGRIPKSWQTKVLFDLVQSDSSITYGVVQPGVNVREGVLFIRGGDVFDGEIKKSQLRMISQSVSQAYRRTILQGGELLMSLVGYPGEVAIVPKDLKGANIARQVALIRLRHDVNAEFVMNYLVSASGKSQLNLNTIGSAQQVINLSDLRSVVIPMPTDGEQKIIVSQLHSMSSAIKQKTKLLDSKKVLKKSLMQDLLTGKVRVEVN